MQKYTIKAVGWLLIISILSILIVYIVGPILVEQLINTPSAMTADKFTADFEYTAFISLSISLMFAALWIYHGITLTTKNYLTRSNWNRILWFVFLIIIIILTIVSKILILLPSTEWVVFSFLLLIVFLPFYLITVLGSFPATIYNPPFSKYIIKK
jgi:hypothetical protein